MTDLRSRLQWNRGIDIDAIHGSIDGISNMGLMGIGGNDKRGIIWIFCYVADFEMHWLGAYGRSSSDGAADLQFLIVFLTFARFPSLSYIFLCFVSLPGVDLKNT